jgi:hypothetical protein
MGAVAQSLRLLVMPQSTADATTPLDPNFAYLRVTRGSHSGLLWRGSTEQARDGLIEVYYSGSGEVVRLQNGRIVGALGLTTEWRRVSVSGAPDWRTAASSGEAVRLTRVRDVMPGYQTDIRDDLVLKAVSPPQRSAIRGVEPQTLTWFEETAPRRSLFALGSDARELPLPPARYAVDLAGAQETVVYAEQCLAPDLCFTWQRWSAALQQKVAEPRASAR